MINSQTAEVVNDEYALFKIGRKSQGIIVYLQYSPGGATSTNIELQTRDKQVDGEIFYSGILLNGQEIKPLIYTVADSGEYRIPYPIGQNEDYVKIKFNVQGDSSSTVINVEIREDSAFL